MPTTTRPSFRRIASLAALAGATVLAGCNRDGGEAPTGQVVATVNGEDVTRRDIQAELQAAQVGADVDLAKVQPLVVDQIVNRKLLVAEAQKEGLDKTPEYLAAERRAREMVLAGMLAQRWSGKATAPTSDQIQTFIGDNPHMFSERRLLQLDQIRVPAAGVDPKALQPLTTNDQVAAYLTDKKLQFARGAAALDTITLTRETMAQLTALPPGMPFVTGQGGMMLISAVTGARPAPVPEGERARIAAQAITRQTTETTLKNQLNSLRTAAKLDYQKGFAPPKPAVAPTS